MGIICFHRSRVNANRQYIAIALCNNFACCKGVNAQVLTAILQTHIMRLIKGDTDVLLA